MQIGVTGATGFIGREVVRQAVQRGHEIVAFTRNPNVPVHDTIESRLFRLEETPDFSECEAVIHLAGEPIAGLWTRSKVAEIRRSRIEGTRRVVEGIRRLATPPEVLVTASGVGIYEDAGDVEIREDGALGTNELSEIARAWENEARGAVSVCRVVQVRLAMVIGKGGGALPVMRRVFRLGLGGPMSTGRQWWPWISLQDAARLFLFAAESLDLQGPMNGVAPWPVRNSEFTQVLARVLRRPAVWRVPAFALRLLLRGFSHEMLDSRRVVPAVATAHGFPFAAPEIETALRSALR